MPRVVGVDIPNKKKLKISLTYIYGVGPAISKRITEKLGLDPERRAEELNSEEVARINTLLQQEYTVEGDKRRAVQSDIKRLVSIGSYRGQRHRQGLPARGQGTQNNARTRKGKKKTVAGKKK